MSLNRILCCILFVVSMNAISGEKYSYIPPSGFVPDEETAIQIAEAIFIPIYGKDKIKQEYPLKATLSEGVWTVTGTLPKGLKGGVALAEIAKDDARIIRVDHSK